MSETHSAFGYARRWVTASVAAALLLVGQSRVAAGQQTAGHVDTISTGNIVGTVRDNDGAPVPGAQVTVGTKFSSVTDSAGKFALRGLPVGETMVTVRRIGFALLETSWDLGAYTLTLDLRVHANPVALPAVQVQARAQPFDSRLAGFYSRMKQKLGYYITRDEIDRSHSLVMTDVLRELPGIQPAVLPRGLGTTVRMAGQACPPLVMIDGFPAAVGNFDLDIINLSTVEGIEVYRHGSSVPADLFGPYGMHNCGVIAIWSRPMRPNVRAYQLPPEHPVNLDSLIAANEVYTPATVDHAASFYQGTANPAYPDSLFRARVAGTVLARFVVDSFGIVEPKTVSIVSATDSLFGAAVRTALSTARFAPAKIDGRPVRQLVEMPFKFDPPAADSGRVPSVMRGAGGSD